MRAVVEKYILSATSSIAAVALVSIVVLLRTLSGDVRVIDSVLENYRVVENERHQMFSEAIEKNSERLGTVESALIVLSTQQLIYHGSE